MTQPTPPEKTTWFVRLFGEINNDVGTDFRNPSEVRKHLSRQGLLKKTKRQAQEIQLVDNALLNRMVVFTWPLFAAYLLSQPWLSDWANNQWYKYSPSYPSYFANASFDRSYDRSPSGMCDTPAALMHCTNGQNFTELAIKKRGAPIGCGCGQGVLGEGLCPTTEYGYTLSDYVSTEPGIAAMLGLGFFPLLGTWKNTRYVNLLCRPTAFLEVLHMWSMIVFQFAYVLWGMASDCIFPAAHGDLTAIFLGAFLFHWVITAFMCIAYTGWGNIESKVTFWVAVASITIIVVGATPRILLSAGVTNLNRYDRFYGLGSYSFWLAEAGGLSITFGAFPILLVTVWFYPHLADLNNDGEIGEREKQLFDLKTRSYHNFKMNKVDVTKVDVRFPSTAPLLSST